MLLFILENVSQNLMMHEFNLKLIRSHSQKKRVVAEAGVYDTHLNKRLIDLALYSFIYRK